MSATLSLSELVVRYGESPVLSGVSFSVAEGSFSAVLGPSGCGKTTLLRAIAGLERPQSGELRLGPRMLAMHGIHLAPEKRRVGWVPQDSALFPHLTVAENVAFGLARSTLGVRRQAKSDRVAELIELVELRGLEARMPHQLSGGQAQRVALARALANQPLLVLLDEPFAGLDPILRADLRVEVKAILGRAATTTLLVTHDQEEALTLADRLIVMRNGRVEQFGAPSEVYATPATLWAAQFLGDTNVLPGRMLGERVQTELGELAVVTPAGDGEVSVMIRPESLGLKAGNDYTVLAVEFAGHDGLVTLTAPDRNDLRVRVAAHELPKLGDLVAVDVLGAASVYPN